MIKKFFSILEKEDKKRFFVIVFLMAIAGVLETLSIGILIPFISFLLDPDLLLKHEIVLKYFSFLLDYNNEKLVYVLLFSIFICFLLKALFFIWYLYQKTNLFLAIQTA